MRSPKKATKVPKAAVIDTPQALRTTKNDDPAPPSTPQSEFKLLADALSPSFGGASGTRFVGFSNNFQQSHGVAYSPLIPFSQTKNSIVPSSREWFASETGSSESSNEWSNGIPEFSFSEAGSPAIVEGNSIAERSLARRGRRRQENEQEADGSFCGLFAETSQSSKRSGGTDFLHGAYDDIDNADEHDASSSIGMKRRKTRRGSNEYEGAIFDTQGSPLGLTALHAVTPEAGEIVRCNCKRSKCLKLYCDCLRVNKYCEGCNCTECSNTETHSSVRNAAVASIIERNPDAFKARITEDPLSLSKEHLQGCHCKKSACLKKYCECFSASAVCTERCKCSDCANGGGSNSRGSRDEIEDGLKKSKRRLRIAHQQDSPIHG